MQNIEGSRKRHLSRKTKRILTRKGVRAEKEQPETLDTWMAVAQKETTMLCGLRSKIAGNLLTVRTEKH